jgi:hypothetical protein
MAQVVEDLPSKLKALSSNPCITHTYPKKKKKQAFGGQEQCFMPIILAILQTKIGKIMV